MHNNQSCQRMSWHQGTEPHGPHLRLEVPVDYIVPVAIFNPRYDLLEEGPRVVF